MATAADVLKNAAGLGSRHLAVLRAVAGNRAEVTVSRVPDIYVDGRCCTDHTVAGVLTATGLITPVGVAPAGGRVPVRLTAAGSVVLTASGPGSAGREVAA